MSVQGAYPKSKGLRPGMVSPASDSIRAVVTAKLSSANLTEKK